ncbi:DUF2513 domain-containing protein [Vibrio alginolyticus]|uniref:DUF2513 domain-containing protein n=1 Tax=Vibrio alginolyticus TaxID=663 RepID=UPI003754BC5A
MKRDMTLIREILLSIEDNDKILPIDGFTPDSIESHAKLLIEAQLIERLSFGIGGHFATTTKLTWSGHEFIDSIREEHVWDTIKTDFKEAGMSTITKVAKDLADSYIKRKIEAITG